ncbi:hypothetical protein PAXINDRAFT_17403 [Paxillus involutus ATCC 200175]|uniref:Uncharacterized protein n=1 Tax=Paxillus involutus ATCC 200175 TaxID=664439 RepID=A0A0C9TQQ0_PAXIN|nr:hypothetical protein PAXINDRAFT_17403 [Paxillus involutus ATCC 200175]
MPTPTPCRAPGRSLPFSPSTVVSPNDTLPEEQENDNLPQTPTPASHRPATAAPKENPDDLMVGEDMNNLAEGVAQSIHAPQKKHNPAASTGRESHSPSPPEMEQDTITAPPSPGIDRAHLPQFTPTPIGDFPIIHLSHAAQLFDHISEELLDTWFRVDGPKILVHPFDYDGKDHFNKMPILTDQICTAVNTIAAARTPNPPTIKVFPPTAPCGYTQGSPTTFLAYCLSSEITNTIVNQRIWSSPTITFEARPFRVEDLPSLLLRLSSFTTTDETTVLEAVQRTWDNR